MNVHINSKIRVMIAHHHVHLKLPTVAMQLLQLFAVINDWVQLPYQVIHSSTPC